MCFLVNIIDFLTVGKSVHPVFQWEIRYKKYIYLKGAYWLKLYVLLVLCICEGLLTRISIYCSPLVLHVSKCFQNFWKRLIFLSLQNAFAGQYIISNTEISFTLPSVLIMVYCIIYSDYAETRKPIYVVLLQKLSKGSQEYLNKMVNAKITIINSKQFKKAQISEKRRGV